MILFEANAVAPLVKLPDAAEEEGVQSEKGIGKRAAGDGFFVRGGRISVAGANRVYNADNLLQVPTTFERLRNLETRWQQL
jgi:hypothetical protein